MAYGSTSIIENLGTVFVFWEIFFLYILIMQIIRYACFPLMRIKRFKKFYEKLNRNLFWGAILRFGIEIYLEAAVAVQINIRNYSNKFNEIQKQNLHNLVSYAFAIFLGIFIVSFQMFSFVFLLKYRQKIKTDVQNRTKYLLSNRTNKSQQELEDLFEFYTKYSTIFKDVSLKSNWQILFFPIFLLRRLTLSLVLVQLENYP